jgi:hypothetical protein
LASVFLTIGCHQPTGEERARAEVERIGGDVLRDGQMPGTPVVKVLLSGSRVTDGELSVLANFPQLRFLDLRKTAITNRGLIHLERLTKLQQLYLDSTLINDAGLSHLEGLTELRKLSLSETRITDLGLGFLKGLPNLEDVNLRETKVSREDVERLQKVFPKAVIRH